MKIEIIESNPPCVRLHTNNGGLPSFHDTPCTDMTQARTYASGLLDGARALRGELQVPTAWHYAKPDADALEAAARARPGVYSPELAEAFREGARELFVATDSVEIPADANVIETEGGGGAKVAAWIFVPDELRPLMAGENETYAECGSCGHYHRTAYQGDCRNDAERFTAEQLENKLGAGWEDAYLIESE